MDRVPNGCSQSALGTLVHAQIGLLSLLDP